jgi:hypothetical protein
MQSSTHSLAYLSNMSCTSCIPCSLLHTHLPTLFGVFSVLLFHLGTWQAWLGELSLCEVTTVFHVRIWQAQLGGKLGWVSCQCEVTIVFHVGIWQAWLGELSLCEVAIVFHVGIWQAWLGELSLCEVAIVFHVGIWQAQVLGGKLWLSKLSFY